MYIPPYFQGPAQPAVFDFIEAHSFGLLVSGGNQPLGATHLPLLLRRDIGPHGQLVGHVARANPHWSAMAGQDVLAIFSGPHAYISPRWYEAEDVVPTWNYLAVHARGRCELIDDEPAAAQVLTDYVTHFEGALPQPWSIDPSTTLFQKLAKMIVAFRIDIVQLEAKWKLNQNQPAERQAKVARHLVQSADPQAREIGQLLRAGL